jgi:poly-gamma-glutamate capsule biosynthesis protein CapA/YwtB (metallophosphatase superfamily)
LKTVLIGADLCPIEGNLHYFEQGDEKALFNDIADEIKSADLAVANLECPLIEQPSPIRKTGPVFGASNKAIQGIKNAGFDLLCLANNHIMDHGAKGLANTLKVCADAGIDVVGAGENLSAARRIVIKRLGDLRVGVLAVAEYEFSIARREGYGANPLDLIDIVQNIREQRSNFDYLIVLIHGSAEFHVPTPRIKKVCRFLVEMGANTVVVQHPHALGGFELYQGGHIVYGQGALVMDEAIYRDLPSFHEGFLVKLEIQPDRSSSMQIVPFIQSTPPPGARRMSRDEERAFRSMLKEKSAAVVDDTVVQASWNRFCDERKYSYMSSIVGHNRILRMLNSKGTLTKLLSRSKRMLAIKNLVRCETHREALETIFNEDLLR